MEKTLNDQLKEAERDKYLAEAAKIKAEQKKIDLDFEIVHKDYKRNFLLKKEFWKAFPAAFLWTGFVGFFINFVVYPTLNAREAKNREIRHNDSITLVRSRQKLYDDSVSFHKQIGVLDSNYNLKIVSLNKVIAELNKNKTLKSNGIKQLALISNVKLIVKSPPHTNPEMTLLIFGKDIYGNNVKKSVEIDQQGITIILPYGEYSIEPTNDFADFRPQLPIPRLIINTSNTTCKIIAVVNGPTRY